MIAGCTSNRRFLFAFYSTVQRLLQLFNGFPSAQRFEIKGCTFYQFVVDEPKIVTSIDKKYFVIRRFYFALKGFKQAIPGDFLTIFSMYSWLFGYRLAAVV
jgi:hypothetical protein